MRKILASLLGIGVLALAAPAFAQDRVVIFDTDRDGPTAEIGLMTGYPTGITGKAWLDYNNAIGVGLGFVPATDSFIGNVDYLIHTDSLVGDSARMPFYIGLGLRGINYDDDGSDFAIGPRMPIGVTALFEQLPISLFAEIAPALEFDGDGNTVITADASIGGRVWF